MSLTSLANLYMGTKVNTFYPLAESVTVNSTLELLENGYTTSNLVKRDLEKKLVDVIQEIMLINQKTTLHHYLVLEDTFNFYGLYLVFKK